MKKVLLLAAAAGLAFAVPASAYTNQIVYGQEDCKEGEKWNEETQKCEASQ
ncbi:MAG: hypothetical protein AAGF81_04310 [Pseudomonadota bacterium]